MNALLSLFALQLLLTSAPFFEPDPTYLWKNYNEMPDYAQHIWLDVLEHGADWDFCFFPPHRTNDDKFAVAWFCKFYENQFVLEWVHVVAETVPDCNLYCSNLWVMEYGRWSRDFKIWSWRWSGPLQE